MKKIIQKNGAVLLTLLMILTGNLVSGKDIMSTEIIGKGQPLVLIHGMACSSAVWDEVVEAYKDTYEIHLVTLKGFGNKEEVEAPHYLQAVRDELIEYTRSKGLKNTILMGHSMGGFLSLWAAAEAPDLFAKVVSVDGIPYFPVLQMPQITPESAKELAKNMKAGMANMDEKTYRQNQEMMMATMIATESKRPAVVEMGSNSHPAIIGQAYGEMFTTDLRPEMHKIKIPVLVLGAWAAYQMYGVNKASVENNYQSQLKDVENASIAIAEKAYHFIFYDEPDWFFSQVNQFIQD